MIRVYFDWNVYTNLKKETENPFKSILSIIKNNKGKILFPYSPAHLNDLKRGFSNNENAKSKTYTDLNLLQEISNDHCLYFDKNSNKVLPYIINPIEQFNDLIENGQIIPFDIDNPFNLDSQETTSILWQNCLNELKKIPSGLNSDQINLISEKYGNINDLFKNLRNENNFYNLLKDVSNLMVKNELQSTIYKTIRNASVTGLKIKTDYKQWGNPFEYLDKLLVKNQMFQSFQHMIDGILNDINKEKPSSRFDYFINYYLSLDVFGYYPDKVFPNLIDDATHAYYGAHCDIFVTDDKYTYHKVKEIYNHFNIATKVCKAADFPSEFYQLNEIGNNNPKNISEQIVEIIRNSFILLKSMDDEFNPVTIYKIQHPIADFFNRMQISHFSDSTSLFIYKKTDNYSTFLFWTEIKSIVNKIVSDLGIDDNLKAEFNPETEQNEISNKVWEGRIWKQYPIITEIIYNYEDFGLALRITLFDLNNI